MQSNNKLRRSQPRCNLYTPVLNTGLQSTKCYTCA